MFSFTKIISRLYNLNKIELYKNVVVVLFLSINLISCKKTEEVTNGTPSFLNKLGVPTGEYVLWTDESTKDLGSIRVEVDGIEIGRITKNLTSAPDCGNSGSVSFSGIVGTHQVTAYSEIDFLSWSFDITISENKCDNSKLTCQSCIKPDLAGNYTAISSGTSADPNVTDNSISNYQYSVVIVEKSNCEFEVSDVFGGLYINWYGSVYGYTMETPASIIFCDYSQGIQMSNFNDFFNGSVVISSISYDENSEEISLSWSNEFGDIGSTVFIPQ